MLTDLQLKTLVADNLADDRLYSIQRLLTDLLERKSYDAATPRYRIQKAGVDITTLAALITALQASSITVEVAYNFVNTSAATPLPIQVVFNDIKIDIDAARYKSDGYLAYKYSNGVRSLGFIMGYVNDGDMVLPMKIVNVTMP